ncbi:MAG: hypothetical protein AAGG68_15305 [Bacteroidota bacterium]
MKNLLFIVLMLSSFSLQGQDAYQKLLDSLFQAGEYEKVIIEGQKILEKAPEHLNTHHLVGRSFYAEGRPSLAIPHLQNSNNKEAPKWMKGWSLATLGVCYYLIDEIDKARLHLIAAIELRGTANSVKTANGYLARLQLHDYFDDWNIIETEHIRFHFQQGITNETLFVEAKSKALEINNQFFGAELPKKIDYYV